MSELSKQALVVDNNQSFPNNNAGAITPSVLRAFNTNMIDSTVNQTQYTSDSASFNTRILATGSFATTGSNTFTGNQNISGSIFFPNGAEIRGTAGQQTVIASNTNLQINPSSSMGINAGSTVGISGSNVFIQNLRYPNFDGTAGQVLSTDGAGIITFITPSATINTGSFATTGSNTFVGEQRIYNNQALRFANNGTFSGDSGSRLSADSNTGMQFRNFSNNAMYFEQYGTSSLDFYNYNGTIGITGSATQIQGVDFIPFSASLNTRINSITGSGTPISVQDEGTILGNTTSFNFNGAGVTATLSAGTASITIPGGGGSIDTGSFATTGSNTFRGTQTIITSNNIATIAADNGVAIGPTNGAGNGIATGAIRLLAQSGSLVLTNNSYTNNSASLSHLSASDNTLLANFIFKPNVNSGTTQISGSGNIFTNPAAPVAGRVNYIGGTSNLFLNGQSQQLPQITGSAASVSGNRPTMNGNIINGTQTWTINQAVNPGIHTYAANVLIGPGVWTFNTTGNTGNVSVNNNLGFTSTLLLNSPSRSIAEINAGASGSNVLQISNNTIAGQMTYNGPVSSSIHGITNNNIAGQAIFNLQSGSRALTFTGNIINGTSTLNDNTTFIPTLGGTPGGSTISNNNINGAFIANQRASSSLQLQANNINTWTISNDFDASAITNANLRFVGITGNVLFGTTGNNIYASGSQGAVATQRAIANNILGGSNISASVTGNGTESNLNSTIGVGNDLHIVGTTSRNASNTGGAGATIGSAFFGRYNKLGQGFNTTAEVILAVGTGTSGSTGITRKTGLLIDSGSNTFVEGTLNVSGSLTIQSGSTFFANGNRQYNVGAFQSGVSQSGSANVSQSMNFEVTDISSGVSIASNSQITLANSGTYNIQFSAQTQATGGADNLYIWLKKNGTNVNGSAGNVEIANNQEVIAAWNYVVDAAAGDYFELAWQAGNTGTILLTETATGNIPSVPSVILTVTQVR